MTRLTELLLEFGNGTPPLPVPPVLGELRAFAHAPPLTGVSFHVAQIDARPLIGFVADLLRRAGASEDSVVDVTGQGAGAPFDRIMQGVNTLSNDAAGFGDFVASNILDTAAAQLARLDSDRAKQYAPPPADDVKHVYGVVVEQADIVRVVLGPKHSMAQLYEHVRDKPGTDRAYYFHVKRGPTGIAEDVREARGSRRLDVHRDAERFRALAATQRTAPWASILGANGTLEQFADAIVEVTRAAGDNAPAAVAATGALMQNASDNTALAVRRYMAVRAFVEDTVTRGGVLEIAEPGADPVRRYFVDGADLDAWADAWAHAQDEQRAADVRAVVDGGE